MHSLGGAHLFTVEKTPSGGLHLWGRGVPSQETLPRAGYAWLGCAQNVFSFSRSVCALSVGCSDGFAEGSGCPAAEGGCGAGPERTTSIVPEFGVGQLGSSSLRGENPICQAQTMANDQTQTKDLTRISDESSVTDTQTDNHTDTYMYVTSRTFLFL